MVMQRISNVYTSRLHLRLHYRARETIGLLQCETPGFIILFCPTYGRLTARPKSSRLHGVGSDGAACLPEQSERCWWTEGTLNCSMVLLVTTGHYRHCNWPVEKASPGMCPCKCGHFEHLLWTNACKQFAFFMCFWFKRFCPWCQIFTVLML